ncbi:MAG TPA: NUDIX hydrolase [Patescibacteria group bacterium]|nr:NUDIX hydrolase [Patescibacteria group bacterium]
MQKKVKMGKLETVYKGKFIALKRHSVSFSNGEKKTFEYCERPDSITILPFDAKGQLLMIKEYRHDHRKSVWFLPAGSVKKGEAPVKAAHRELREETGYDAKKIKKLYSRSSGSSIIIWNIHLFAAKDLFSAPLKGDEEFPIKVVPMPLEKAVKMALNGTIENEFIAYHIIRFNELLESGKFKW